MIIWKERNANLLIHSSKIIFYLCYNYFISNSRKFSLIYCEILVFLLILYGEIWSSVNRIKIKSTPINKIHTFSGK